MTARPLVVVDDDAAVADMLVCVLAEEGYVVVAATSQRDAAELFTTAGPDAYGLVLSDSLSDAAADRFGWLDHLRTLTTAPVVSASGHPQSAFAGWQERGFAAVLPKPFDLDELATLVVSLCGPP